jgi:hypothetical protein
MSPIDPNQDELAAAVAELSPAALAREAALLASLEARADEIQQALKTAEVTWCAALQDAHAAYSHTVGPLRKERAELEIPLMRAKLAEEELSARRKSVEDLRAQLAAAEAELPF